MPELSLDIADARLCLRVSACPSLFRVVPARDGGICRIKLPLGHLCAAKARAVAAAALRFGNGIVDATNRANLQIRGIRMAEETILIRWLVEAGLGPASPEADDVRNVMVSPTAGIDPLQEIDALPIARDLLGFLETDAVCRALSPKFGILVDGGEGLAVVDRPHDVWLASIDDGTRIALGFAGAPPTEADDQTPFVAVRPQHAVAAAAASLSLFAEEAARNPEVTRFRHLFAQTPRAGFLERLAERFSGLAQLARGGSWRRRRPALSAHVGVGRQLQHGLAFIGAVPPLGRLSPDMLVRLAEIAEEFGNSEVRLTPWQSVILPSVPHRRAPGAVRALEAAGLICDPGHPLSSIVACSGLSGCARGSSDTKADALALVRALGGTAGAARSIHLSGCAKSCACAGVADVTLVASAPGTYELFVKADRGAGKFGRSVGGGLSIAQAVERLRETAPEEPAAAGGGRG